MRTLLFDIDGTLLLTNQAGSIALRQALSDEFDLETPDINVSFGGRTDRSLLAQLLTINNLPNNHEFRDRLERRYASVFPETLEARGGQVFPGVTSLLNDLHRDERVRVCVMTGNLIKTGEQKLRHFDLLRYVQWVSGGEHDADRDDLARRTARIVQERHGSAAADDIIVIGDTVADIRCGHAIGAKVIAVCTGSHDRERLESENPSVVLDDLAHTDSIFDLLVS